MDEPFGALDAQTREDMQEMMLLLSTAREDDHVLFVTHDVEEAIYLSTRILVFSRRGPGRIVGDIVRCRSAASARRTLKLEPDFLQMKRELVG